ncbi:MAG: hypothetical protein EG822_13260 [Deltaproteobacteria bacterium]|nr:hypothetical protein [Deltaproteobacteria bacterium]TLN02333.1 MAG: hypothetical protein FDZ73_12435 [bacterium]
MACKKKSIWKIVIVVFILSAGVFAFIKLSKNVNFKEILPEFLNFITSSAAQQFVSDNAGNIFFSLFFISVMALCYRHNRKIVRKGLKVDDKWLDEKPDFISDPMNCNVSGNYYYTPDK